MKLLQLTVLLFILLPLQTISQVNYGIKGTVKDSNDVAIESGNVILLSPLDSTVIKGIHFWDGSFELLGISEHEVLLKITADGYSNFFERRTFEANNGDVLDLGSFSLGKAVQDIEGVSVVHRRPMFQREVGKLVVNVEGTILSDRGTALDLLKSAPNVIVKSNGDIIVVGKGSAIVYVDGQRINSVELLSSLSSNEIDHIEIMETPSVKYDAEGNAVIEIFTKKGVLNGYELSLGYRGMARTYFTSAYWGDFSWRKNWFSLNFSAGQYTGKLKEEEKYFRTVFGNNPIKMDNVVDRDVNHKFDTWIWLDMDFRLDSLSTISLSYTGSGFTSEASEVNENLIHESGVYTGRLDSRRNGISQRMMNTVSLGYNRDLDTLGSAFNITGQFRVFDSDGFDRISQISNFGTPVETRYESRNFNDIYIYSARADYNKVFSDKFKFDVGVKTSYVTNNSGVDFKYLSADEWISEPSLYNGFEYGESIMASYAEVSGKVKKFSYNAGLRYEWTLNAGYSKVYDAYVFDREYQNLFPNVLLNYELTKDLVLGASYTNRIQRPSYQDLDPYIIYVDSLTSFRGNPELLPAYSHNAEISLVYMEYASISFGYTKTKNPLFLTVEQNTGTNTFSAITKNIESSEMYTIGLVLPYELDWWTTFNAFGYTFNTYLYRDNATLAASNEPMYYVSLYNEFRIPKWFNIELTYDYVTPGSQGFFVLKPYQALGGSISRKFFKDQLTLRFNVFDVLLTEREQGASRLENFEVSYDSWMDSRSFMFTAIWNFGKLKDASMKGKRIDKDEKDRIKED